MAKKKLTIEDVLVPKEEIPYEVPENWCWTKMNIVCDVRDGTHDSPQYIENGIPLITSKNLKNGNITFENVNYISQEDHEKIIKRSKVDKGDILFGMIGTIGSPVIVENVDTEFSIKNVALFKPREIISNKFVYYYVQSMCYMKYLEERAKGSTQKFIALGKLRESIIPIPPLAEQERIVKRIESLLDKVDKASELVDEARDGFEKRRAAILERAFCGELTNSIPRHIKLKECGKFITDKKEPEKEDYYLGLEHFGSGYGIIGGASGEDVKSTKGKFKKGDILYGRLRPYLDKHDIVDRDGICSTDILIFRCDDEVSINKYINYFMGMNDFKSYAMENSKGINLPRVSAKVLEELVIPIFTVEEQIKIVTILDNLFSKEIELSDITNIDDNIELIKKSILANAFRGELGSNDLNDKSSIELIETLI